VIRFLKDTSFPWIIPILIGVGMIFSSCSMTKSVVRTEKTEKVPIVTSGLVDWSDEIDLRQVPVDEVITDDGTGVFEIEPSADSNSPLLKGDKGGCSDPAKVTFRYRVKYIPKDKIQMSIDSATVETQKEIKTVALTEKTVVEKKFYRYLSYVLGGMVLALIAVIWILRKSK
jgi:hypothetical protein